MPTYNKADMMNCCRGWHDFSDGATECLVCGAAEDEASAPNATGLAQHHGLIPPPSPSMVKAFDLDGPNDTIDALMQAEAFVGEFEKDETRKGVSDILAGLRAAIKREQAAPVMLAALLSAAQDLRSTYDAIAAHGGPEVSIGQFGRLRSMLEVISSAKGSGIESPAADPIRVRNAAPAMLAALKGCLSLAGEWDEHPELDSARAAIAAAEGRSDG